VRLRRQKKRNRRRLRSKKEKRRKGTQKPSSLKTPWRVKLLRASNSSSPKR
jgi:hypothetical protein